jgi:hypothetical protein
MIKDTLYAKYISQRAGYEILENEHGFVIYKINGEECFIVDMFVDNDKRGTGACKNLINSLVEIAKEKSCKFISGNIHLNDIGCNTTIVAAIYLGFKIIKAEFNILAIKKDLE